MTTQIPLVSDLIISASFFFVGLCMLRCAIRHHVLPPALKLFFFTFGGFLLVRTSIIAFQALVLTSKSPFFLGTMVVTAIFSLAFAIIAPIQIANIIKNIRSLHEAADVAARLANSIVSEADAQWYHEMADVVLLIMWTANPDGSLTWYNKRWYEYTGSKADDTPGWVWEKAIHPDDLARTLTMWKSAMVNRMDFHAEFRLRRQDGHYRWHKSAAHPLMDNDGNITKWCGYCIDIEEEKRREFELRHPDIKNLSEFLRDA